MTVSCVCCHSFGFPIVLSLLLRIFLYSIHSMHKPCHQPLVAACCASSWEIIPICDFSYHLQFLWPQSCAFIFGKFVPLCCFTLLLPPPPLLMLLNYAVCYVRFYLLLFLSNGVENLTSNQVVGVDQGILSSILVSNGNKRGRVSIEGLWRSGRILFVCFTF